MKLPTVAGIDLNDYVTVEACPAKDFDQTGNAWFGVGPVTEDERVVGVSVALGRFMVAVHHKI